jgi:hypothetical protein
MRATRPAWQVLACLRILHARDLALFDDAPLGGADARISSAIADARDLLLRSQARKRRRSHICAGTGLVSATSAPGLGSPLLPHLRRDWTCPSQRHRLARSGSCAVRVARLRVARCVNARGLQQDTADGGWLPGADLWSRYPPFPLLLAE